MIILDSNVWIAFLNADDSQHKKAEKVFRELEEGGSSIIITEYVILEVCSVLVIAAGKQTANTFIEYIFDNADVSVLLSDETLFLGTVALFRGNRGKELSFVDVSLFYLSGAYRVISFDAALEKAIRPDAV